jgi:hypothetical protein
MAGQFDDTWENRIGPVCPFWHGYSRTGVRKCDKIARRFPRNYSLARNFGVTHQHLLP